MKFSVNQILIFLLYGYVFLAPFEDILEFLYGIDTVLKPYRVFGIFMLLLGFFYRFPKKPLVAVQIDWLIVIHMVYAALFTYFLYAIGKNVNLGIFLNTMIQMFFLLLIHLTVKRIDLTYKHLHWIMFFLTLGLIINAGVIITDFYIFKLSTREKGLSDNSNYAALSMVLAALYYLFLLVREKMNLFRLKNLFFLAVVIYFFFGILATGSRTGFILLTFCSFLFLVVFSNLRVRIRLVPLVVIGIVIIFLTPIFSNITENVATFNRLTQATEDVRVPLAKAGFNAIKDTWGMGIGIAQMIDAQNFNKYIGPVDKAFLSLVDNRGKGLGLHNMYIEMVVEVGFIGSFFFFLFLVYIFVFQLRRLNYKPRRQEHILLLTMFIAGSITGLSGKGLLGAIFWLIYTLCSYPFKEEPIPEDKSVPSLTGKPAS
ncbi:MAG: O-antigen ligase family protein [Bacteroidota bacterium]